MAEEQNIILEESKTEPPVEEKLAEESPAEEGPAEDEVAAESEPANPQWMLLRAAVGAYLIYLAYALMRDTYRANDMRWYFILFAVIFAGVGIFMIVYFIRRYLREIKGED